MRSLVCLHMADANSSESPLEAAADIAGARATEAFSLLGNETRLAILLALWEAFDPFAEGTWDPTEGNTVTFSDLRERVGLRDSGQFNYHLGKLEGQFVEQTPNGYRLLPAGTKIVQAVIAIAGFEEPSLDPTEIDLACPNCDAPTGIIFQNQRLYYVCTACDGNFALDDRHPSGVLSGWISNPAALRNRTAEAIYSAVRTEVYHNFAQKAAGICSACSGQVESTLHVCDAHDPGADTPCPACGRQAEWMGWFVCSICKSTSQVSVPSLGLRHPAVVAFYWEHGIELGTNSHETARQFVKLDEQADEELVSRNPPRVRVTLRHEGDALQLTYDEELNVVEVNEDY